MKTTGNNLRHRTLLTGGRNWRTCEQKAVLITVDCLGVNEWSDHRRTTNLPEAHTADSASVIALHWLKQHA